MTRTERILTKKKTAHTKHYKFWRILILKAYFDKGLGVTSYAKYFIAMFGIASRDVSTTLWITFSYAISCFVVGYLWYRHNLVETENEINNVFNPFVAEMREKI